MKKKRAAGCFVKINAQHVTLVSLCLLAEAYGCLCAFCGQLLQRISIFHWDYTSALIPVGAIENQGSDVLSGCC